MVKIINLEQYVQEHSELADEYKELDKKLDLVIEKKKQREKKRANVE